MRVVAISDTHGHRPKLPDGDVLVCAGDYSFQGTAKELKDFNEYIGDQSHKAKVCIAGNHDWLFQSKKPSEKLTSNYIYLQDSSVQIDFVNFYGSPWQPEFGRWAFNLPRGIRLAEKWNMIPDSTHVLITHGPPWGYGDMVRRFSESNWPNDSVLEPLWKHVGCSDLIRRVNQVKPRFHIFGHIHGGYGKYRSRHTTFLNASVCNEKYENVNKPLVFNIEVT